MSVTPTLRIDADGTVWALSGGDLATANAVLEVRDGLPYAVPVEDLPDVRPTVSLTLARSTDGGETWTTIGEYDTDTTIFDYEGLSSGDTLYRAVAATEWDATSEATVTARAESPAAWVMTKTGDGTGLRYNLSIQVPQAPVHSDLVWLDGATDPTVIEDNPRSVSRRVTISADLLPHWMRDADGDALTAIQTLQEIPGLVTARLPDGQIMEGSIRSVQPTYAAGRLVSVQVTIEEARTL